MKLVIKIKSAVSEAKKSGFYGAVSKEPAAIEEQWADKDAPAARNLDPVNETSKKKNNRKKKE